VDYTTYLCTLCVVVDSYSEHYTILTHWNTAALRATSPPRRWNSDAAHHNATHLRRWTLNTAGLRCTTTWIPLGYPCCVRSWNALTLTFIVRYGIASNQRRGYCSTRRCLSRALIPPSLLTVTLTATSWFLFTAPLVGRTRCQRLRTFWTRYYRLCRFLFSFRVHTPFARIPPRRHFTADVVAFIILLDCTLCTFHHQTPPNAALNRFLAALHAIAFAWFWTQSSPHRGLLEHSFRWLRATDRGC